MISDEAVEAALEVSLRQLGLWGRELPEDLVEARRQQLTELLESAAPHMLAAAWDEGAKAGADYEYRTALAFERCTLEELTTVTNPYRSQA